MFINLITGANGGGTGTAGVTSLNDQKGDLKLKTVNNNDLLGEGNIEIQAGVTSVNGQEGAVVIDVPTKVSQLENDANFQTQEQVTTSINEAMSGVTEGMEKVYMAQLDEAGRKEFFDYVKANLGDDGIYHGNKWPFMTNNSITKGSLSAIRIGLISTNSIVAHFVDIQNGDYYFEKITKNSDDTYSYRKLGPRALVSNISEGTIYISEQTDKTLALNNTDVDVPVDVVIPFTKINSLSSALENGYPCVIKHKTATANFGNKVTIPATIYSYVEGDMATVVFDFEGTNYWYKLNSNGTKMSFYRSTPLPNGNINSSEVSNIKVLTQAEYDAIDPKDEKTLYMIKG